MNGPDRPGRRTVKEDPVVLATALERGETAVTDDDLATRLRALLAIPGGDAVTGARIVARIEADPRLSSHAGYNLACFYSRLMKTGWQDSALGHLIAALEHGGPEKARSAWEDPGVVNLRTHAPQRFRAALVATGYTPPSS